MTVHVNGDWLRARGGRVQHFVEGVRPFGRCTTLCGKKLYFYHKHSIFHAHYGPTCKACNKEIERLKKQGVEVLSSNW